MLLVHVDDDFDDTFRRLPIESFNHQSKQQEKQTQIYHNDIVYDINQLQNRLTTIKSYVNGDSDSDNTNSKDYLDTLLIEDEWNNSHINGIYNLFLSNNKYILIDFEYGSSNQSKSKKRINDVFSTSPVIRK